MPSLKDIKTRINSVKNTRKITKAMKMVAAAKLSRAQSRVEAARPYSRKMKELIANLAERADEDAHPLLEEYDDVKKTLIYVVSSNRGLCGGFNATLFRELNGFIAKEELSGEDIDIAAVGRKAAETYKRDETHEVVADWREIIGDVSYENAKELADEAIELFLDGEYQEIYIAYNQFISAIQYEEQVEPLLPLDITALRGESGEDEDEESDEMEDISEYIYEPDEDALLANTLPNFVEIRFLQALLESDAAEQGARMTAMDNATTNAEEMIDDLTLQYNRARQAYITKEICEIVSGAASLKG
jgi:F-type H+-transporting ATPase subunit gamma